MSKINKDYELMAVYSLKEGEEAAESNSAKFKELIEKNGSISNVDEWGKRKLAYPINDETEGYYVVYDFNAGTDFPKELSRILNITDGVLRSLITIR